MPACFTRSSLNLRIRKRTDIFHRHLRRKIGVIATGRHGQTVNRYRDVTIRIAVLDFYKKFGRIAVGIFRHGFHVTQFGSVGGQDFSIEQLAFGQTECHRGVAGLLRALLGLFFNTVFDLVFLIIAGGEEESGSEKQAGELVHVDLHYYLSVTLKDAAAPVFR